MASFQTRTAAVSSVALRFLSYFFLRWGLLPLIPAVVFGLFAIYVPSFISGYKKDIADDVVVRDTTITSPPVVKQENGKVKIVSEEVEIHEVIEKKPYKLWRTLLGGRPNPRSPLASYLTFVVNILLVGMVADRLFREHLYSTEDLSFVRVGHVSDTEAKFLIREPDQTKMPVTLQIRLKDPEPPFEMSTWQSVGGVRWTLNETDYTAVLTAPLRHSKQRTYVWQTSNNHSGEFTSAPKPGQSPDLFNGKFTFLSTSCIVQRLPYNPSDHALAIPGMRHLAKVLPTLGAQFMLFLGDFIYIDVPKRWGTHVDVYRQEYRQVYASPDWSGVGQNLSWIHVLDDHEIANDWHANKTGVYEAAVDPWHHYQTAVNPPPARQAGLQAARAGVTYFEFSQGPASFFMLDTRTYRSSNLVKPYDSPEKTMLGKEQLEDLLDWLQRPEPKGVKWKIVASSVPLTKNWRVNTQDTWGGFLAERQKILEAMWEVGTRGLGVVVLSGDRHEFAATKFPPPAGSKWPESSAVHEFSVSPLSQFYSPIPTYRQTDDEDIEIKYINKGNSKFGAITLENMAGGEQSTLTYRIFIDGVETWDTVVLSPPEPRKERGPSFWDNIL
ncbi:hypothetical protein M9X92_002577 [Pyricularia oryzae]|nr:hypothetical protein M9X92_002577 [Pyricularia oryzae]